MFKPTFFDHHKAFAIALSKDNKVSQEIEAYDFMYGTETELHFKHYMTRQYVKLNYQGVEL